MLSLARVRQLLHHLNPWPASSSTSVSRCEEEREHRRGVDRLAELWCLPWGLHLEESHLQETLTLLDQVRRWYEDSGRLTWNLGEVRGNNH